MVTAPRRKRRSFRGLTPRQLLTLLNKLLYDLPTPTNRPPKGRPEVYPINGRIPVVRQKSWRKQKMQIHPGMVFSRWKVIERSERKPFHHQHIYWVCECKCGKTKEVKSSNLINHTSNSCGCGRAPSGHGKTNTGAWISWKAMWQRIRRKASPAYKYYGGRGITVCDRWKKFENFLEDMGDRPEKKSLDRIDTNGDYEPRNCRWATVSEQLENRRDGGRDDKGKFLVYKQ